MLKFSDFLEDFYQDDNIRIVRLLASEQFYLLLQTKDDKWLRFLKPYQVRMLTDGSGGRGLSGLYRKVFLMFSYLIARRCWVPLSIMDEIYPVEVIKRFYPREYEEKRIEDNKRSSEMKAWLEQQGMPVPDELKKRNYGEDAELNMRDDKMCR